MAVREPRRAPFRFNYRPTRAAFLAPWKRVPETMIEAQECYVREIDQKRDSIARTCVARSIKLALNQLLRNHGVVVRILIPLFVEKVKENSRGLR